MTALALRVFWVSLSTSFVLLPLLALEERLRARIRAESCYLLWLLLGLRLLLPVQPELLPPPVVVELPPQSVFLLADENSATQQLQTAQSAPQSQQLFCLPLSALATGVWITGAAAVSAVHLVVFLSFRRKVRQTSRTVPSDGALCAQLGGTAPVLRCGIDTPMTLGLLYPVILLPHRVQQEDLPLILRHELCHLRRHDLWYKALFLLICSVHWFNPLVWRLSRAAGRNLELCCDEAVVAGEDFLFRRRYGQMLLRSAAATVSPAMATRFDGSDLKGRLMNLYIMKKRGIPLVCAAVCAALLSGSLVSCKAQSAYAAPAHSDAPGLSVLLTEQPQQMTWPLEDDGGHTLSALFGSRIHPLTGETITHTGLDIPAPQGTPVLAAKDAVVLSADFDPDLGNYVILEHNSQQTTLYAHLSEHQTAAGDTVVQGQCIGLVGRTGKATGPHLHFELQEQGIPIDPLSHFPGTEFLSSANGLPIQP